MAVTHVLYEADGWGVGELVVDAGKVVWHELPWPRPVGTSPEGTGPEGAGPDGTSPGGTGSFRDPSLTPTLPGFGVVVSRKASRQRCSFVAEVFKARDST